MQKELDKVCLAYFSKHDGKRHFSYPLLPVVSQRYLENRIVIIGQETNSWYKGADDDLAEFVSGNNTHPAGFNRYEKFVTEHVPTYKGNFWRFSRRLYEPEGGPIKGRIVEKGNLGHLWLNLFFIEQCKGKGHVGGRPTNNPEIRKTVIKLQKDLLKQILIILKPKLVISMTSPGLDPVLKTSLGFESTERFQLVDRKGCFNKWQLAQFKSNLGELDYQINFIRSYHPTYFMGRINRYNAKFNLPEGFQKANHYYQHLVMNYIKDSL